ncbi:hypothetical protein [Kutzneria sp. CA-103260]|uniref:hypothetical protein n=1 Tax=Kutzneria sp. CA-103260 TaxID=2802641 RepID=UPI001BA4856F|nr:hypothetical protein [Kutzneria sp. CA-103260]QUQ66504.1 hypothetical protein JJ691_42320 [Kutzneria sp. CA-103260]
MTPRVHLHVGLPKTGTTHLQNMLWHNRDTAAAQGLLYPGYVHSAHFHAAVDLQRERYPDWASPLTDQAWDRLVAHIRGWPGDSVISSELLATATKTQITRALRSLDFAEVHVICTARDLARQIPSMWQENTRNRRVEPYGEFLAAIRADDSNPLHDLFWSYQDLPRVLAAWGETLPPQQVHVVTVPAAGPGLWHRYASTLNVAPDRFAHPVDHDNHSLGAPQTEVLRRVNIAVERDVPWPQYDTVVKEYLAHTILAGHGDGKVALPAGELPWVRARAERFVTEIERAGYDVVGDLDDLLPTARPEPAGCPTDAELLDTAVTALADLVAQMRASPDRDTPTEQIKRLLREFSEQHPPVMALRELYWKGKAQLSWARRR